MTRLCHSLLLLLLLVGSLHAAGWEPPARRRPQFERTPGYALLPVIFDIPGIGNGYGLLGGVSNIGGSNTDVLGSVFGGDVVGEVLGINELHLVPERLILDFGTAHLSTTTIQSYSQRGMASDRNDYTTVEFGNTYFDGFRLTASFVERRYELYGGYYSGKTQLKALRDRSGQLILDARNARHERPATIIVGARLDLTDDYRDPRRGFNLDLSRWASPPSDGGPDSYLVDLNATAYIPLGRRSTWAFNYFRSDAHVRHRGETDRAAVAANLGLDCTSLSDPEEQRLCDQVIDTTVAANTYGTATSLGGLSRLRAYPEGRYNGAHTEFFGSELRWNLTDEATPFNIVIMRDIRTAVQLAAFYEIGSIVDRRAELWRLHRSSYGAGCRVVTASGLVYRIDLASGEEGFQPSIFFDYPWTL